MVEVYDQSEDKNDSEMCNFTLSEEADTVIVELNSMRGRAKEKIEQLIEILRTKDKLKDHEIKKVLFTKVDFVSRKTIYNALPQELKREYTKPLPKTINISTPHKVIEPVEEYIGSPEPKQQGANAFDYKPTPEPEREEDAQGLEIQFLKEKVAELEDALKKTQQFTPATQLQEPSIDTTYHDRTFAYLQSKADGIHSFYYDTYGIDLFKNRELSQLKNSGVKVFKRLYFEV